MELNREQLIKALVCMSGEEVAFCRECGYNGVGALSCRKELAKDALSLIKELTEENERLRAEGEWITPKSRNADDWKECSRCGYYFDVSVGDIPTPFCPNCGARMKGE